MTVSETEKNAARIIRKYLGTRVRIYLFGSWAKGNARNSSVHSYSEKVADALYEKLHKYLKLFQELEKGIKKNL